MTTGTTTSSSSKSSKKNRHVIYPPHYQPFLNRTEVQYHQPSTQIQNHQVLGTEAYHVPIVSRGATHQGTRCHKVKTSGVATRHTATNGNVVYQQTVNRSRGGHYSTTPGEFGGPYRSTTSHHASYTGQEQAHKETILSERIVEHEIKVPKRIVREDIIEKLIVVPEKIVREDIIEEIVNVREKIVEVAKPVIQERIVEVPEIEYVEKIVEVPEKIVQENVREVPKIEYQDRVIEIPKFITQEKIVEVPEIEYREVAVEKVVEIPEYREHVIVKEVPVPQYVDKPVPEYVTVEVPQEIEHNVPVPIEAITSFAYKLPKLQPKYNAVELTLYVPRFVEVPVPAEFMEENHRIQAEHFAAQVNILAQQKAASLCEVENLAGAIKGTDFGGVLGGLHHTEVVKEAWSSGRLKVENNFGSLKLRPPTNVISVGAPRGSNQLNRHM